MEVAQPITSCAVPAAIGSAPDFKVVSRRGAQIALGVLAGAYYLKPNFPGRASHIADAGYVVAVLR